jgi:hypothetical protein
MKISVDQDTFISLCAAALFFVIFLQIILDKKMEVTYASTICSQQFKN